MHHGGPEVAASGVELRTGKRRHELHSRKPVRARLLLAAFEQQRPDAAAGGGRIDEEGANFRGLGSRVERRRIAIGSRIAAEQGRSEAPAAAPGQSIVFFGHKIGPIGKQLGIDAERAAQGAFDLRGPVVWRAQAPRRTSDQRFDLRNVGERGQTQQNCYLSRAADRSMANAA